MPALALYLGNLLFSLASLFGVWVSKQVAIRLALITGVGILTAGFIAAINSAKAGLSAYVIPQSVTIAASWLVPSNLNECVGAIFAAYLVRWVYAWNVKFMQYKLG
jgi:hypothetical protein